MNCSTAKEIRTHCKKRRTKISIAMQTHANTLVLIFVDGTQKEVSEETLKQVYASDIILGNSNYRINWYYKQVHNLILKYND